jgi:hypothetical protein
MDQLLAQLQALPLWWICIAAVSFVVTITGVIAWQVFMNRMEADAEKTQAKGHGIAPPTHPEPLKSWCAAACAAVDGGTSWADEPRPKAQQFLGSMWGAQTGADCEARIQAAQQQPQNAWTLVGVLRVAVAGISAGYLDPARGWGWARQIAQSLQRTYPSFDALGADYLAGRRAWKQLPPDGSGDDPEQRQYVERLAGLGRAGWRVDYRAPI